MKSRIYVLLLVIIIFSLFLTLTPAVSYRIFPQKRAALLASFITSLQKSGSFDTQKFWEFREFYSPGTFIVDRKYKLPETTIPSSLRPLYLRYNQHNELMPYLVFHSSKIESLDAISKENILLTETATMQKYNFQSKSVRLSDEGKYYMLITVTTVGSMKKANGYLTGEGSIPLPTEYSYLSITKIWK